MQEVQVITVNIPHSPIDNNYIEAGKEFGFGLLINNVQAFGLNTFEFECRFLSGDSSFYTFIIDSFRTRYENEYDEMIRTFTGLNEAEILKCSGKEKIKFAETLQEGIITFNIYTHFNQLIFKKDELYHLRRNTSGLAF